MSSSTIIKPNVKAKTYIAKIFFGGITISLRLYFRNIDKHAKHIENASIHVKEPFINDEGRCGYCSVGGCVKPDGSCSHRKTYIIDGITYEKCDGKVFYFHNFNIEVCLIIYRLLQIFIQPGVTKWFELKESENNKISFLAFNQYRYLQFRVTFVSEPIKPVIKPISIKAFK